MKKQPLMRKVKQHLRDDMATYKEEYKEDASLMRDIDKKCSSCGAAQKKSSKKPRGKAKIAIVMEEFKEGKLRSGSKKGPKVKNPKQAIAIAISESKKKNKKRK